MEIRFFNQIINSYSKTEMSVPRPLFSAFKQVKRHWLKRTRPPHIERQKHRNFEFTVASYNVLADILLQEHPHLYSGNHYNEPWVYDWNYRKKNLLEELKLADADILCLQEVQEEHYYNWFSPRLCEVGYTGLYKKRSGTKEDGCATFFKNSRFSLQSYQFIDFHKENCSFMDRNNVAILVFLQPLSNRNHSSICVGNTHLLFNKKRGDIKLAQLAYLFAEVDRWAKDDSDLVSKYLPILLCGDFNSTPCSPLYELICKGVLRYEGLQRNAISGQSEIGGGRSSFSTPFTNEIFPRELGLTERCQWRSNNTIKKSHVSSSGRSSSTMNAIENSVANNDGVQVFNKPSKIIDDVGTGILRHEMSLRSSYLHYSIDGTPEVTTCHERAADTVDYIFHSVNTNEHGEDCGLWLSGVLSLLSEYEIKMLGNLPNKYLSSDHLMLMTSFVLPEKKKLL